MLCLWRKSPTIVSSTHSYQQSSAGSKIIYNCRKQIAWETLCNRTIHNRYYINNKLTFFLRLQGHLTAVFLLHVLGEGQDPAWHRDGQRWPHVARFFGHWFLQDVRSLHVCSSDEVSSLKKMKVEITSEKNKNGHKISYIFMRCNIVRLKVGRWPRRIYSSVNSTSIFLRYQCKRKEKFKQSRE